MPDESNGGKSVGRSIVQTVDECSLSEPEVERKRMRTYGCVYGSHEIFTFFKILIVADGHFKDIIIQLLVLMGLLQLLSYYIFFNFKY